MRDTNFELFFIDHFLFNKFFFAVSVSFEPLIILITGSIFSTAVAIPIKICALSSVFDNSKRIFLVTVFSLNPTNAEIKSFRPSIFGSLYNFYYCINTFNSGCYTN